MMKHLRVHGVQINACPVFDALRRPSSVSSSGSGSDAQSGTSVNALQSESDNLQPASQAPRCAQRTPFTITAMGKMSVPQTEECHGKVTAHIVKRLHPFSEVESPTFGDMVKTLNPKYIPPSRDYLANTLIPAWYKKNRNRESSGIGIETKNRNRSNSNDTQPYSKVDKNSSLSESRLCVLNGDSSFTDSRVDKDLSFSKSQIWVCLCAI
ncbi:uncharacterized protein LOC133541877 isoform X1 [Nerophis ophidion]|uniref:uncharacterized protein LOC133541877 isoform X1 n=1 Tax=Nerophis ophidion TaxID=159077 RepID=UPI002ADF2D83|nr:uncharacterized protein LOC133541877 isoform X1 [Nerophis ophidion]